MSGCFSLLPLLVSLDFYFYSKLHLEVMRFKEWAQKTAKDRQENRFILNTGDENPDSQQCSFETVMARDAVEKSKGEWRQAGFGEKVECFEVFWLFFQFWKVRGIWRRVGKNAKMWLISFRILRFRTLQEKSCFSINSQVWEGFRDPSRFSFYQFMTVQLGGIMFCRYRARIIIKIASSIMLIATGMAIRSTPSKEVLNRIHDHTQPRELMQWIVPGAMLGAEMKTEKLGNSYGDILIAIVTLE